MNMFDSMQELIGRTPMIRLHAFCGESGVPDVIAAKVESFNPAGSVKDRVAKNMLDAAEKSGRIRKGAILIEPTSGNTGVGLAAMAAARGYQVILTMPETMSVERRNLLKAYGATLVLTDGKKGMQGAIDKADELARRTPNSLMMGQFYNPANPEAHYLTTGPEIWQDTDGKVDIFIAGVGTGGTISGTGRYLKEQNPNVQIVAVEPADSPVLSGGKPGAHGLMGIGAGFIPETLDTTIYDRILTVTTQEAYAAGKRLARVEGLLCGITSGAALHAAAVLAAEQENAGKLIVALLPDTGERYLSTGMFD